MTARWSYLTPSPEEASSSDEVQTDVAQGRAIPDVAQLQSGKSGYRGVGVVLACETVHVGDPGDKQVRYGAHVVLGTIDSSRASTNKEVG